MLKIKKKIFSSIKWKKNKIESLIDDYNLYIKIQENNLKNYLKSYSITWKNI